MIHYINNKIIRSSRDLSYQVSDFAPSTFQDLKNESSLVIWSGASDNTIFQDKTVNWASRALHDTQHLVTGLNFDPMQEIELGRVQAASFGAKCDQLMADLIYVQIAEQTKYYVSNRDFVPNDFDFTMNHLIKLGYK